MAKLNMSSWVIGIRNIHYEKYVVGDCEFPAERDFRKMMFRRYRAVVGRHEGGLQGQPAMNVCIKRLCNQHMIKRMVTDKWTDS